MATIDWSELQDDLIGEIAKNIAIVEDFVSFSRVCPSWQSAAVKENWVAGPQVPWLALVEKADEVGRKENHRGFFNFKRNTRYEIDIPQFGPSRSWGSSLGWIVTVTLDLEIHMINPLSRLKLRLPHLHALKRWPESFDGSGIEVRNPDSLDPSHLDYIAPERLITYVQKALVCLRNQQLFVAVIYGDCRYLAIARPGDESWTEVEDAWPIFEDVVCFNGQLVAVCTDGALKLCEFDWIHPAKFVTLVPRHCHLKLGLKSYLVESMGELLMVVREVEYDVDDDNVIYDTKGFRIYKLDFEKKKWMELTNLGDTALFLGDSYSLSISSTDLGCESNIIYYLDDAYAYWEYNGGLDKGIFSLKDKSCRPLADNLATADIRSQVSSLVWMIPSLYSNKEKLSLLGDMI